MSPLVVAQARPGRFRADSRSRLRVISAIKRPPSMISKIRARFFPAHPLIPLKMRMRIIDLGANTFVFDRKRRIRIRCLWKATSVWSNPPFDPSPAMSGEAM